MLNTTSQRVSRNTPAEINERIRCQMERRVARYALASPWQIDRRLTELDREWDVERYLETVAPTFTLVGLFLGATHNRKWLILPAIVQTFFLQHAIQGWCPPMPVLRRLGVRTMDEINEERYALKALRGDFDQVAESDGSRAQDVIQAVRR